jgi:hypothetical protein
VTQAIQPTGFYWARFLCLILGILKLTLEMHWSWWRVMLPVWAVLGHNVLYIGVRFLWLSFADDGVTDEEVVTRETNETYGYQLAALFCFAVFADNEKLVIVRSQPFRSSPSRLLAAFPALVVHRPLVVRRPF